MTKSSKRSHRSSPRRRDRSLRSGVRGGLVISPMVALLASQALADPEGAQVAAGSATFHTAGSVTTIHAADRTIINYSSFNIAGNETVRFVQPHAQARVLNRINSAVPTRIDGTLTANGQVYIANPAGVIFGQGSVVNAAAIYAAAGSISDADFLSGVDRFTDLRGEVVNHGAIYADSVHLLGRHVANFGSIEAKNVVTLMAGDEVLIGERGGHIYARMSAEQLAQQAEAIGESSTMLAAGDVYAVAIHDLSSIRAQSVQVRAETVTAQGKIDASSTRPGTRGGRVELLGDRVAVAGAQIDASGHSGGGDVRIGGGFRGQEAGLHNAQMTLITADSTVRADALTSGDGGSVVVWSDVGTAFAGTISASGADAGSGGFVEVSGKRGLAYRGDVATPGGTSGGREGTLLLDPTDIRVVEDGQGDMLAVGDVDQFLDPDTNFDMDAFPNEIEAGVIEMASSDVVLQAERDITFDAALDLQNDQVGLLAQAGRDIIVNQTITTRGGNVRLEANSSMAAMQQDGSITVNAAIDTTAAGELGGDIELVVDGGSGRVNLLADLATDGGNILIDAPLTLTGVRTLDTAGTALDGGDIEVTGALMPSDGASSLELDTRANDSGGAITLAEVGGADTDLLTSLAVSSTSTSGPDGAITLNADVTTLGDQTFDGPVTLADGTATLDAGADEVQFLGTLELGTGTKTLSGSDVDFAAGVTGSMATPPALLITTSGDARVGGATETPGELTLTFAEQALLTGPFASIGIQAGTDLDVAAGTSTFNAPLSVTAMGDILLEDTSVLSTTGHSITLGDPAGGDTLLDTAASASVTTGAGAGDISLTHGGVLRTTSGGGSIALDAGTGSIHVDAPIGSVGNEPDLVTLSTSDRLALNGADVMATALDASGVTGAIVVDGAPSLTVTGDVDLDAARSLIGSGGMTSDLTITSGGAVSLPVVGADGVLGDEPPTQLTIAGGDLDLAGDVTADALDVSGVTGGVVLNANAVITTGSAVNLGSSTGIDGAAGGEDLTIDAPSAVLPAVGATERIGALTLVVPSGVTLTGDMSLANAALDVDGPLTVGADLTIDTNGGDVDLASSAVDASGAGIALSIDATSGGQVQLSGVGQSTPLGSLDVTAGDISIAGDVTTSNAGGGTGLQQYSATTVISGVARSLDTDGTISFPSGFSGGTTAITLSADEMDFGGAVSGTGTLELLGLAGAEAFRIGFASQLPSAVDLTAAELAQFQPGFSSITIGRASSSAAQSILIGGGGSVSFSNPVVLRAPEAGSTVVVDSSTSIDHSGLLGAVIRIIGSGATTTLRPNAQILAADAMIDIQTPVVLEGAGARTIRGTGAPGSIAISGDISADVGGASLTLDSADGGVDLGGSVGSLATPLGTLEVISSAGLDLSTASASSDYFADVFSLSMLTGPIDLQGSTRLVVSGGSGIDLSNSSGVTASGGQALTVEPGAGGASLPAIGTSMDRLSGVTVTGGPATLHDSVFVSGGDIVLGPGAVMTAGSGGTLLIDAATGNVTLGTLTGTRAMLIRATGDGSSTGVVDFAGVPDATASIPESITFDAQRLDLRGDVRASGPIDFGATPAIDVFATVVVDSDPADSIGGVTANGDAGVISIDSGALVTAQAGGFTLTIDATSDGSGDSTSFSVPSAFFDDFGRVVLSAGVIPLDMSIITEGDVELIGRVEQSVTATIDTNADDLGASGTIDLDQAVFHATMPGLVLTLDSSSSDATAGDVLLPAADDFLGAQSFLAGVSVVAGGPGGAGTVGWSSSLQLDATMPGHGLSVSGDAPLELLGDASVSTNADGVGDAGDVDFSGATLIADGDGSTTNLSIDVASASASAGDVTLGAVQNAPERVSSLTIDASGSTPGVISSAATDPTIQTAGGVTLLGLVSLTGDTTIETEGGRIDLSAADVFAAAPSSTLTLRVTDTSEGDGRVDLGVFRDRGGLETFLNGVAVDTAAASDGTLTLMGDVLLSGTTGFTFTGAAVEVAASSRIDTHQAGGSASGPIALNAPIHAAGAGQSLTLDASTPGGVGTTGSITVGELGDGGGAGFFLSAFSADARGDTPGGFGSDSMLMVGGDVSVFGVWTLAADTVVDTNPSDTGDAGQARFTETHITDGGMAFNLTVDAAAPMDSTGGNVLFGDLAGQGGVSVQTLTVINDAGNGTPGAGADGQLLFSADNATSTTFALSTLNFDRVRGTLVSSVADASITTTGGDIDLTAIPAVVAGAQGTSAFTIDAGAMSVMLPSSIGQGAGAALGGLSVTAAGGIEINGHAAVSDAGGLAGTILLDGPAQFNASGTLSTNGGTITFNNAVDLLGGSTATLRTTDSGAAGAAISIDGDVLGQTASTESLVIDAGTGGISLLGSVGSDLVPLALIDLTSSGTAALGPTSGPPSAEFVADTIDAAGLTGDAVLNANTRLATSSMMAVDLGNLASSGVSFGINSLMAGTQTLTIEAPNAAVTLPAMGQQAALGGLQITSADSLALRGGVATDGGDAGFDGTMAVTLDSATGGTIRIESTDGDILFNQDAAIDGAETLVLEAIDTSGMNPRSIRVGAVGTTTRLAAFELTSGDAELWGDILTDGGQIGIFAETQARRSITLDTDAPGGASDAGDVRFATGGERFDGFAADTFTLLIDATADGGATGGVIELPTPFFGDFTLVDLRAGSITLTDDISVDGDLSFRGDVILDGSRLIDTNDDELGDSGFVDLSLATLSALAADAELTVDSSTGESGFRGGNIVLGSADDGSGTRSFVEGIRLVPDVMAAGTSPGEISLTSNVSLDGSDPFFDVDSTGFFSVASGFIATISLNGDAMDNGAGGVISLGASTVRSLLVGSGLALLTASDGQIEIGRVDRTTVALASLTLDSFGGLNAIGDTVEIGGTFTSRADLTRIEQTLTIDTDGGAGNFTGTTLAAAADGIDLTLRTAGSGGTGVLMLGAVNDAGSTLSASFLNDLRVDAGDRVDLNGDVRLGGSAAQAHFEVVAADEVRVVGSRTIVTNAGDNGDSGDAIFPTSGTVIRGADPSATLTIDTGATSNLAGDVRLADTAQLAELRVESIGTTHGVIDLPGEILIDGPVTMRGIVRVVGDSAIVTDADGVGDAGPIDLSEAMLLADSIGHTLLLDSSSASGSGADVTIGHASDEAMGVMGAFISTLAVASESPGTSGDLVLSRVGAGDVLIDVDAINFGGGTMPRVFGAMDGRVLVSQNARVISQNGIDLSPTSGVRNTGAVTTTLELEALGGGSGIVLPAGGVGLEGFEFGQLDLTTEGAQSILALGDVYTRAAGGASGDVIVTGAYTLESGGAVMVSANGGAADFASAMPGGTAIDLVDGQLTVMAEVFNVAGDITASSPGGGTIVLKPVLGSTIGLGDGVDPGLDLLITSAALAAFGESVGTVIVGNGDAMTGTTLIEVGTFDIRTALTLRTADAGQSVLLGSVTTTGDELRIESDAFIEGAFSLDTTGPGGTFTTGSSFITTRTLDGTSLEGTLNSRDLGADDLSLELGTDGDAIFSGAVGSSSPLGEISITNGRRVEFGSSVSANSFRQGDIGSSSNRGRLETIFNGPSLFAGPLGVAIETPDVQILGGMTITGGPGEFSAEVQLAGDLLTFSQPLTFDDRVNIVGNRLIDTTLPETVGGDPSAGASVDFTYIDGVDANSGPLLLGGEPARLEVVAGDGDLTIGMESEEGFVGGVGIFEPNGLLLLTVTSADTTNLNAPVRVGGLLQTSGDTTHINDVVTTFDEGAVDITNDTFIDVDANIESDGPVTLRSLLTGLDADVFAISDPITVIGDTEVRGDVEVNAGPGFGGDITFDGRLNGVDMNGNSLTLNSGVAERIFFEGLVGDTQPLSRVTIEQAQDVTARAMFVVGELFQTDTQDLTLFRGLRVTGTTDLNGNRFRFMDIADFGGDVTITNFGLIDIFPIPVTISGSFRQDGIGSSQVATDLIAVNQLSFAGDVEVTAPAEFGGSNASFGSMLTLDENAFTITADNIDFNGGAGSVSGTSDLVLQPRSVEAPMDLGSPETGDATFALTTEDLAALANGFASIAVGIDGGSHAVLVGDATFSDPLTIRYNGGGGNATILEALTGADNASITLSGSEAGTKVVGRITTQGQDLLVDDALVIGGEPSLLTAVGATLRVTGPIDAMTDAMGSLDARADDVVFERDLGANAAPMDVVIDGFRVSTQAITADRVISVTAPEGFTPGGDVASRMGDVLVFGPTTLITDTTFSSGGSGTQVSFAGAINGPFNAVFTNPGGSVNLGQPVGGSSPLSTVDVTAQTMVLQSVTTTGSQRFDGDATLNGDLRSTESGPITLTGATGLTSDAVIATAGNAEDSIFINEFFGAQSLTLDAGAGSVIASGPLGAEEPLASLAAEGSMLEFLSVATQGAQVYTGDARVNGVFDAAGAEGGITFNNDVELFGSSEFRSGDGIIVRGLLDGAFALTVENGLDDTTSFLSPIGSVTPLTSLDVGTGSVSLLSAMTSGPQLYRADVALAGDLAAGGSISIERTLSLLTDADLSGSGVSVGGSTNGAQHLTVSGGPNPVSFEAIGDQTPLTSFTLFDAGLFTAGAITAGTVELGAINITTDQPITTSSGGLSVFNDGEWQILPGAAFDLAGPFSQLGGGPVAISTDVTTATDMLFSAPVELRADGVTLTGPNVSLLAGARNDGTPRALVVNASEVAFLSGPIGSDASPLSGFSPSTSGRVDLSNAELVSATGVRFDQPVVVSGESIVRVTGTRPGTGSGSIPDPVGTLDVREPLPALSPDSIVFTDVILGTLDGDSSLTLLTNLDATGGLLPKIFLGNDVGLAINSDSGIDPLAFGPLGILNLNADPRFSSDPTVSGSRNGHTTVPEVATIFAPTSISINTLEDYRIGLNEKFTVLGTLTVNSAGRVITGDINALDSIFITAPEIFILSRASAPVLQPGGFTDNDLGVDFIASDSILFNGSVAVLSAGPGQVTLATLSGGNTSSSLSTFSTRAIDDVSVDVLSRGLDLRSEGATNTNVSSALAGAVPRTNEGDEVGQSASVSAAQKDILRKLGVFARDASDEVLLNSLLGRSVYTDYNQPNPITRRQEVTAQRLDEQTVEAVVDVAQRMLFGQTGEDAAAIEQPTQVMRAALNNAVDDWARAEDPQEWDANALFSFMQANSEEHADAIAALQVLDEVLGQVELIGLSPGEVRDQRSVLLGQVRPVRLKLRQFQELVSISQQAAPSTSLAPADMPGG